MAFFNDFNTLNLFYIFTVQLLFSRSEIADGDKEWTLNGILDRNTAS